MLEEMDALILEELEKDASQGNVAIAKKLKVSEGTVRQRVARLRKKGIIQRYTIDIATKTGFSAFVLIQTNPQINTGKIAMRLKKIKGVKKVVETTGDFDAIVKVVTISAEIFNLIIEKIRTTDGVTKTDTLVVLKIN
jgi:DNA-binding Lrp family transcriptional regulator